MNIQQYPEGYTDRQLMESIWRRIDGLAAMLAPKLEAPAELSGGCSTCGHTEAEHRCLRDGCCGECACTGFVREDLLTRLVAAIVDVLEEDDPFLLIGIGNTELKLTWSNGDA